MCKDQKDDIHDENVTKSETKKRNGIDKKANYDHFSHMYLYKCT